MARDQHNYEQVLQTCLDLIESGQESVEAVLARYPDIADQLRPELEVAVWLSAQKDLLNPRPGWMAASKRRVMMRYQEEMRAEPTPTGWLGWSTSWIPWLNKRVVQVTFALVLLLSLVVGGNGVVMAAQDSLPGDRLYPIKTALEKVNLAISTDETKEAQLQLQFTQRRMQELNRLVLEGRDADVQDAVTNLETQVNQTIQALDSAADQNASQTKQLAATFADLLREQNEMLDGLADVANSSTLSAIQRAKTVSQSGATATTELLQALPSPTPTTKPPRRVQTGGEVAATSTRVPATNVPTKTLRPLSTNTPRVTPTPAPLFEPVDQPTATKTAVPTSTATNTPRPLPTAVPTDTRTPTPTATNTPTDTPVPPSPTPTDTPVPPTPTPTDTPVPPTPTPTTVPSTQNGTPTVPAPTPTTTSLDNPTLPAPQEPTPPALEGALPTEPGD